jgi:hypothetical protein
MKHQFLVVALGYWGRGVSVHDAAERCQKAGCKRSAMVSVSVFVHPTKNPEPIMRDLLSIEYEHGSHRVDIGAGLTLGQALNLQS